MIFSIRSVSKSVIAISIALFVHACVIAQQYQPTWQSLDQRSIPEWYGNAKFGIFIHWGLYSVPAWATNSNADGFGSNYAEWYWQRLNAPNLKIHKEFVDFHEKVYGKNFKYQDFAQRFTCEMFDPQQWASIIKSSGAKYVVLTSKHHEGFTLWPSKESWNWNAMDLGPHRDLAGDLSKAIKDAGLHMGFYYSLYEWYNPVYKDSVNKYVNDRMIPQLKDLVNRYNPDVLWADGDWEHSDTVWKSREFLAWLFNESAVKNSIVTNDRWGGGKGHSGFITSEYGKGESAISKPWEETRGIGESFGYNRNESLEQYASSEKLVHQLIDVVSRGGNLLLNIGPSADGLIPVIMQQRLKDIGDWLHVNGEAIYETTAWKEAPADKPEDLFFTRKGKDLYIITTKWREEITMENIAKATGISMLGVPDNLQFNKKGNKLVIASPKINPGNMPCAYAWVYKISGAL